MFWGAILEGRISESLVFDRNSHELPDDGICTMDIWIYGYMDYIKNITNIEVKGQRCGRRWCNSGRWCVVAG